MRIAMWSGPRNLSTAMMYAFGNRRDFHVVDEPFYAAYLARTAFDHPMRAEILASLERAMALSPEHPAALHLYIHAVEASADPARAEAAADALSSVLDHAMDVLEQLSGFRHHHRRLFRRAGHGGAAGRPGSG